ncbi:hypothetical protein EDB19DRAFT_1914539 [Suillus lakei]|nr:hypothetical protein EDB19DRAFT_1914539 [Suillus lakei]
MFSLPNTFAFFLLFLFPTPPLSTSPLALALAPTSDPVSTPNAQSDQPAGLQNDFWHKVAGVELAGHGHEMGWNDSKDWNDGGDHESHLTMEHNEQPPCLLSDPFDDIFNKKCALVAGGNLGMSVAISTPNKWLPHPCALKAGVSSWRYSSTCSEGSQSTQAGPSCPCGQTFKPVPLGPAHSAKFSSNDRMQQWWSPK